MFSLNHYSDFSGTAVACQERSISWASFYKELVDCCQRIAELRRSKHRAIIIMHDEDLAYPVYVAAALVSDLPFVPICKTDPEHKTKQILNKIGSGICIDASSGLIKTFERKALDISTIPASTAYIIFTSGSTGDPKGVMIDKHSILGFVDWFNSNFPVMPSTAYSLSASYSFDLSLMSIFPFLANGQSIWRLEKGEANELPIVPNSLGEHNIHWVSTPSFMQLKLLNKALNPNSIANIGVFNFCGEALSIQLAKKLKDRFPKSRIFNSYGPTEATIAISTVEIEQPEQQSFSNLLPIAKLQYPLQLLDSGNGFELQINGPQVMSAYLGEAILNTPDIVNTASKEPVARRYKTGDIVDLNKGHIYFKDRADSLVKYRGYRIDLSEIDAILAEHQHIEFSKTLAISKDNSIIRLVSFCLSESPVFCENRIKTHLSKRLPQYAIPSEIRLVDSIPISKRHKLSTTALLELG